MPSSERIVIVGASLAGATAAAALRAEGFDGDVTLVGEEPHAPYERPELSKSFLRGEAAFERLLVRPDDFWIAQDVELRTGVRADAIDVDRRIVALADGDELPFDRLLLATGSRNRAARLPGADAPNVHLLRTVDDCERLRAEAIEGRSAVIGGMSFIGSEVAASLRQMGLNVAVVVSGTYPLERILGEAVGRSISEIHRAQGVRLVSNDRVAALEGRGRAETVVTTSGARLECDLVVLALGVEPATDLVRGTAIEVDDGIVVDDRCRTNVEDIFAAGDVTRFLHPTTGRRMRVEHWQHARRHGRAAARSMLGAERSYDEVPWFWSDQFDHEIQWAGFPGPWDDVDVERDEPGLMAYYSAGGVLAGAASLDRPGEVRRAMPRIAAAFAGADPGGR